MVREARRAPCTHGVTQDEGDRFVMPPQVGAGVATTLKAAVVPEMMTELGEVKAELGEVKAAVGEVKADLGAKMAQLEAQQMQMQQTLDAILRSVAALDEHRRMQLPSAALSTSADDGRPAPRSPEPARPTVAR